MMTMSHKDEEEVLTSDNANKGYSSFQLAKNTYFFTF